MARSNVWVKSPWPLFKTAPGELRVFLPIPTTLLFFVMGKRKPVFLQILIPDGVYFFSLFLPPHLTWGKMEQKSMVSTQLNNVCSVVRSRIWVGASKEKEGLVRPPGLSNNSYWTERNLPGLATHSSHL